MSQFMLPNTIKVSCSIVTINGSTEILFLDPNMIESLLTAQQKRTRLLQEKYNMDAEKAKEQQEEVCSITG